MSVVTLILLSQCGNLEVAFYSFFLSFPPLILLILLFDAFQTRLRLDLDHDLVAYLLLLRIDFP